MADTKVDIWNMALTRISVTQLLQTDTDDRPEADVCNAHWESVLREVLEDFEWPFAIKQATLAAPAGVTRLSHDYVYTLPADCVTPLALLAEGERRLHTQAYHRRPYDLMVDDSGEGLLLATNNEQGQDFDFLEYVAFVDYVAVWPGTFKSAVAWRLAVELALAIPKKEQLAGSRLKLYEQTIAKARANALNSIQEDVEPTTPSIAARG